MVQPGPYPRQSRFPQMPGRHHFVAPRQYLRYYPVPEGHHQAVDYLVPEGYRQPVDYPGLHEFDRLSYHLKVAPHFLGSRVYNFTQRQ